MTELAEKSTDTHLQLAHSESRGWEVNITCAECNKQAEGEYSNDKDEPICNSCA